MNNLKKKTNLKNDKVTEALAEEFDVVLHEERQGKLSFHMPEEFYHLDKKIAKIKIINIHDEVRVIEGSVLKNFEAKDIKHLIESSDDVKKVVVEQVSANDAKRLSLLYNADGDVDSDLSDAVKTQENVLSYPKKEFYKKVENTINFEFLSELSKIETHKEPKVAAPKTMFELPLKVESKTEVIATPEDIVEVEEESPLNLEDVNQEIEDIWDDDFFRADDQMLPEVTNPPENALYRRQTLVRKTKKRKVNDFYYKAKNHKDLFKVGNAFFSDVKEGIKSFSFASLSAKEEQEKTIFGIAAFFSYHSEMKVTIITDSLADSYYLEHVTQPERKSQQIEGEDFYIEYYESSGIVFIEIPELVRVKNRMRQAGFEDFLDDFVAKSELILWDLPSLDQMNHNRETFFPITMVLENVSIIVQPENTELKEIDTMLDYFNKYSVAIKGLVIGKPKAKPKKGEK